MALMKSKLERREAMVGYLLLLPWIISFVIFLSGPILVSFGLSFFEYDVINPPKFIGIQNYKTMISDDPLFWQSFKVTAIYTVTSVPLRLVGALAVAILLNQKIRGIPWFRTVFYLPAVVSGVAVALLWSWVFNPNFGVLNYLLDKIGIQGPAWLGSERWALPAFIIMSLWSLGGGMLIFLAGLQSIPTQLYEASEIDGANWWSKFWKITIPMLTPTIFFNLVMGIIGTWQVFTAAYVMTQGGPNYATLFYMFYLYKNAFVWFKMGYASALAWLLFLVILICTLAVFKSSPMWVYYEAERRR
jgi:multiple sugar transport system permease protein